ncbi:uncharacterized protein LOC132736957 [Ruditapes philippinarum]|uniref:uncharacterized protein LOC132736957 n=1 Tax=Ruditapes philippinarum TaxID=129788 RepID=UPI00295AA14E|nr:uncharacterized protein LOC132736957 [Ruditapes philippinarum]
MKVICFCFLLFVDLCKADASIVFTTPEALQNKNWRKILLDENFKKRLCLIACDEAHCISDWGEDFRPEFREISSIRSFIDAPFIALTATATDKVQEDIFRYLLFDEDLTVSVAVIPDRPNIFLQVNENCTRDFQSELEWYLKYLLETDEWKKTIVFCRYAILSRNQVFY